MRFDLELPSQPSASHRVAVLLINLGTPDAPTPRAVRKYLAQFLSDPRVIETPQAIWQPILQGIILSTRPQKSGANYARIWDKTENDSPLRVLSRNPVSFIRSKSAIVSRRPRSW